jgi:hypothetical protein
MGNALNFCLDLFAMPRQLLVKKRSANAQKAIVPQPTFPISGDLSVRGDQSIAGIESVV